MTDTQQAAPERQNWMQGQKEQRRVSWKNKQRAARLAEAIDVDREAAIEEFIQTKGITYLEPLFNPRPQSVGSTVGNNEAGHKLEPGSPGRGLVQ